MLAPTTRRAPRPVELLDGPLVLLDYCPDFIVKFSTEIIDKYMPKKGASADEKKKIMATWAQMYWAVPDAMLVAARKDPSFSPDLVRFSGTKIYFIAWDLFYPDQLLDLYGKAMPPCPNCYSKGKGSELARAAAAAAHVNSSGWAQKPRRFVDMDQDHYVRARQYRCSASKSAGQAKGCGRCFMATDPDVLSAMPPFFRERVPCYLTRKAGISTTVKTAMERDICEGRSFNDFAEGFLSGLFTGPRGVPTGQYYSTAYQTSNFSDARREQAHAMLTTTPARYNVLKFDHCHKPSKLVRLGDSSKACIGTAWALNGASEVMGVWQVSSTSVWDLREELHRMSKRAIALGEPIRCVYVDNAAQTERVWRAIIDTDVSGGVMVKQDTYHLKRRFMEAVPRTHKLRNTFSLRLSEILLPAVASDVKELSLRGFSEQEVRRRARKYISSGRDVLDNVKKLLQQFKQMDGGADFITASVEKVLANQMALVANGRDMISDPFPLEKMYYMDETGHWRSIRTTSQVENLNRRYNGLLQGPVAPGLCDHMTLDFLARSNIDQAARRRQPVDPALPPHFYDLSLVTRINSCFPKGAEPFGTWEARRRAAAEAPVELFGFKWQEAQVTGALVNGLKQQPDPMDLGVLDDEDADGAEDWEGSGDEQVDAPVVRDEELSAWRDALRVGANTDLVGAAGVSAAAAAAAGLAGKSLSSPPAHDNTSAAAAAAAGLAGTSLQAHNSPPAYGNSGAAAAAAAGLAGTSLQARSSPPAYDNSGFSLKQAITAALDLGNQQADRSGRIIFNLLGALGWIEKRAWPHLEDVLVWSAQLRSQLAQQVTQLRGSTDPEAACSLALAEQRQQALQLLTDRTRGWDPDNWPPSLPSPRQQQPVRVTTLSMFQHAQPVQSPAEKALFVELGQQHRRDYEEMATVWNTRLIQSPTLAHAGVTPKTSRLLKEFNDQSARALEVAHMTYAHTAITARQGPLPMAAASFYSSTVSDSQLGAVAAEQQQQQQLLQPPYHAPGAAGGAVVAGGQAAAAVQQQQPLQLLLPPYHAPGAAGGAASSGGALSGPPDQQHALRLQVDSQLGTVAAGGQAQAAASQAAAAAARAAQARRGGGGGEGGGRWRKRRCKDCKKAGFDHVHHWRTASECLSTCNDCRSKGKKLLTGDGICTSCARQRWWKCAQCSKQSGRQVISDDQGVCPVCQTRRKKSGGKWL
eukprot:XP_001701370.1 predicted protein [Chlamydomonas reinhardtii]